MNDIRTFYKKVDKPYRIGTMKCMKKLTCRDLGGPCDAELIGNSFQEIGKKSHEHVMEQINVGEEAHKVAAAKMKNASLEEQKSMMAEYERNYNEASEV